MPPRAWFMAISKLHKRHCGVLILTLATILGSMVGCRRVMPLRLEWLSMGTVAAIQSADHTQAHAVRQITRDVFEQLEVELSLWQPQSTLSQVNLQAGSTNAIVISTNFYALVRAACAYSQASRGAFNPLLGPVIRLWGFNQAPLPQEPPQRAALKGALSLTHLNDIHLDASLPHAPTLRLAQSGMSLDLGAIAKGFAVDIAWQQLQCAGQTNLMIDLGGNLRALGCPRPNSAGWHTGIRHPYRPTRFIGSFLLHPTEATATSGNYERFVKIARKRYPHILDGRSGLPVQNMLSVTVIAPTATMADALSTILFILGPSAGQMFLTAYPASEALWLWPAGNGLQAACTAGFNQRLKHFDNEIRLRSLTTSKTTLAVHSKLQ